MKLSYVIFAISWLLVASSLGLGCSDDPRSCEVDDDCFGGESCVAAVCQSQSTSNGDVADNNSDDTGSNNNADDTSTDDSGPIDGGHDATNEDAEADHDSNIGHTDTCEVNPFTVHCENDDEYDNDGWIDADKFKEEGSLGCDRGVERPEAWSRQIDGTICHDEAGDVYRFNVSSCDSQFRLTVSLTVPEMCTDSEFALEASQNGGTAIGCQEDNEKFAANCERNGNVHTWTLLIKPHSQIWSLYFSVVGSQDEDIASQFDYTLEAEF